MKPSSAILTNPTQSEGNAAPLTLLLLGFIAAFGAGKLPPVLPAVQTELSISLIQAGVLLSIFQLAGALAGVFVGALADRFGRRRQVLIGLVTLAIGSLLGGFATAALPLLISRAIESAGFMFIALPIPALMRAAVSEVRLSRWLGLWGTYMPTGFAAALIITPWLAGYGGWRGAWFVHAGVAVAGVGLLLRFVPPDRSHDENESNAPANAFMSMVYETVRSGGPWLCAICFASYAGTYLSIVGFLPTIYQQAGYTPGTTGGLTALVAAINILGNVSSGQLIHRGFAPHRLIIFAALVILVGSWLTYAAGLPFVFTYAAVLTVSAVMGLIPGSLFFLATRFAPGPETVSTTIGLMQQGSSAGQLLMPILVAAIASRSVGWHNTWWVTGSFALLICVIAVAMGSRLARR